MTVILHMIVDIGCPFMYTCLLLMTACLHMIDVNDSLLALEFCYWYCDYTLLLVMTVCL